MAFIGDAMAHASLPGVAIAYILNGNPTLGALATSIIIALGRIKVLLFKTVRCGFLSWLVIKSKYPFQLYKLVTSQELYDIL